MVPLRHIRRLEFARMRRAVNAPAHDREPATTARILISVLRMVVPEKKRSRAARLRHEASNCVALAVSTHHTAFAAELIDEALKLTKRSQEIGTSER